MYNVNKKAFDRVLDRQQEGEEEREEEIEYEMEVGGQGNFLYLHTGLINAGFRTSQDLRDSSSRTSTSPTKRGILGRRGTLRTYNDGVIVMWLLLLWEWAEG